MGRCDRADAMECGGYPEGWQSEVRSAHLCQPAGHLPAQGGRGRLEGGRDAYAAYRLGDLQASQRGRFLPSFVHHPCRLGRTRGVHQLRRCFVFLLPLDQRALRGVLEEFAQYGFVRHHALSEREG